MRTIRVFFLLLLGHNLLCNSIELDRTEKIAILEAEAEKIKVKVDSTIKYSYNNHINVDYTHYKKSITDVKDTYDTDKNNEFFYSEFNHSLNFNSKFKLELYDDIKCFIPFGFNYKTGYPSNIILPKEDKRIERSLIFSFGFFVSWEAVENLEIGISGDLEEETGTLVSLESRLFKSFQDDERYHTIGRDLAKFGIATFSKYEMKNKYFTFDPNIRLKLNKGRDMKILANQFFIFSPVISLPLQFKINLLEDLDFKFNPKIVVSKDLLLNDDKDETYSKETHYENSGFNINGFMSFTFDYTLFNILNISLPLRLSVETKIAKRKEYLKHCNEVSFKTMPKISLNYDLIDNIAILADVTLNYMFLDIKMKEHLELKLHKDPRALGSISLKYMG